MIKHLLAFLVLLTFSLSNIKAQTWVDSLDNFGREAALPPNNYGWTWQNAPMLQAMEIQHELFGPETYNKYVGYVETAMIANLLFANSILPNSIASGHGFAYLYRMTGNQFWLNQANRIYKGYKNIVRVSNGGVSHLPYAPELWDDTIYMIGIFLLQMYKATLNEEYWDELVFQIKAHQEKLLEANSGFWVHGWDDNNTYEIDFCSQPNWADNDERRSQELWGRGNGWVIVMMSEMLKTIDESHADWDFLATSLESMLVNLPPLQDETTGHWYQLPFRNTDDNNFLESSCTAMFGYGMLTALNLGIVEGTEYKNAVHRVYRGLRDYSIKELENSAYYNTKNVAAETCIGDANYYYNIGVTNGKIYSIALFVIFGRMYEDTYFTDVISSTSFNSMLNEVEVYPNLVHSNSAIQLKFNSKSALNAQLQIVDVMGRKQFEQPLEIIQGQNINQVQLPNLSAGKYIVLLQSENNYLTSIPISVF